VRALAAALALLGALVAGACGIGRDDDRVAEVPGSTLRATVVDADGDGALERGPAERLFDRTTLAPRGRATREVARFGQLTDTHVRDEESPARVPFLDRLGPPVTSTFRPHEALSPQVLAAAVRALNAERPRAVLVTGDLVDSAQRNELEQLVQVLGGGRVEPDTGRRGYRGVQRADNADGFFYRPAVDAPRLPGLLSRAQRVFVSPGLTAPWYAALGNHDLLVQGELPPSPRTDAVATGGEALLSYDPALEDLIDRVGGIDRVRRRATPDLRGVPPETIDALLAEGVPGRTTRVPADAARRHLRAAEAVDRLRRAGAVPRGAGGGERLDYGVDLAPGLRAIVLDTVDRTGGARGVLAATSLGFLRGELSRAGERTNLVVVSHHGLERTDGGDAALALLDRDPRVVAELFGDTHRHEITARRTSAGGFWRINTASLADWPQQGRMLRLVTGADGARALETWVVDHAGGTDTEDLAGAARTLAFLDAQGGRPNELGGGPADRNARLWLPPLP
jgi:3',5'-cyclic AMP phosphodiesterase CpdA